MTILASQNMTFQPKEIGTLVPESSLWALRNNKTRMEFAQCTSLLSYSVERAFYPLEAFFDRLDHLPKETLKAFTVKELKEDFRLGSFLTSKLATYSDRQFIKIPVQEVDTTLVRCVSRRLAYIFHHKRKLFTDGKTSKARVQETRSITLRDIRRLKSGLEIMRFFSRQELYPYLLMLSPAQKSRIRSLNLFQYLIRYDEKEEMPKYILKMSDRFLNHVTSKVSKYLCDLLPPELIQRLDLSKLPDSHFYRLVVANVGSLDKLSLSPDKIKGVLERMMTMILTRDAFPMTEEKKRWFWCKKENIVRQKEMPRLDPWAFVQLPDSVFLMMDFVQMNADQLFCLFHPKSLKNDEYFGDFVEKHDQGHPGCPIRISSFSNPILNMGYSGEWGCSYYSKSSYLNEVRRHEDYNKRRLALLSPEVYRAIRPRLHREIVKLGDDIFPKI